MVFVCLKSFASLLCWLRFSNISIQRKLVPRHVLKKISISSIKSKWNGYECERHSFNFPINFSRWCEILGKMKIPAGCEITVDKRIEFPFFFWQKLTSSIKKKIITVSDTDWVILFDFNDQHPNKVTKKNPDDYYWDINWRSIIYTEIWKTPKMHKFQLQIFRRS